jgi:malonyl-CoA decarboxylase
MPSKKDFSNFFKQTLSFIELHTGIDIAKWGKRTPVVNETSAPSLLANDINLEASLKLLIEESISKGETLAKRRIAELSNFYLQANDEQKKFFFRVLSNEFDVDYEQIRANISLLKEANEKDVIRNLQELLDAPRNKVLKHFNLVNEKNNFLGLGFLVEMRADLLRLQEHNSDFSSLEYDLKKLLTSWFDVGLLDLKEINWNSPAALLEKIIKYEAVHAIDSWSDLKNRLDVDRKCYAFFHPKMPSEPLIFVEIAFSLGISSNIDELLNENKPQIELTTADSAIFYSISSTQKGLSGISFGNFLIKRVVEKLLQEQSNIKYFATLSPIPGFKKWLDKNLIENNEKLLTKEEQQNIFQLSPSAKNAAQALYEILGSNWHEDQITAISLKKLLVRLCTNYLVEEKKDGKALDPVAHFHLSNGARLERINYLADTSLQGRKQSATMMANYYYELQNIDYNYEQYINHNKVMVSKFVRSEM